MEEEERKALKLEYTYLTEKQNGKIAPDVTLDQYKANLASEYDSLVSKERMGAIEGVGTTIKNFIKDAAKPLFRVPEIAEEERTAALDAMKAILPAFGTPEAPQEDIPQPSLGQMARGAVAPLQYALSPLNAVTQAIGKEPTVGAAQAMGASPGVADFAGNMVQTALDFVPPGGAYRKVLENFSPEARMVARNDQMARLAGSQVPRETGQIDPELARLRAAQKTGTIPEELLQARKAAREEIDQAVVPQGTITPESVGELAEPSMQQGITKGVSEAASPVLEGTLEAKRRLFKQVAEHIQMGEIPVSSLPGMAESFGLSAAEKAKFYQETISASGRHLGYLSRLKRELGQVFENEPEALKALSEMLKDKAETPFIDYVADGFLRVDKFRRAMLLPQLATTMRNIASQAGRLTLSMFDEGLQGVIRSTVGAEGRTIENLQDSFSIVTSAYNRMTPTGRKRFMDVLGTEQGEIAKARMFSTPIQDAPGIGKLADSLNTLNRLQEFYFRKIGFEAKMRQLLSRGGEAFETINPKNIPEEFYKESADYALEMTFAASPKSNAVRQMVRAWGETPILSNILTTIQPFPKFNMANAIPFVFEHSPLGYLKAFSPSVIGKLASGNSDEFAKYASRATIGSFMLDSAMKMRQSDSAGEKYYEVKTGEDKETGKARMLDTRSYAPFSTYLGIAEAIVHPEKMDAKDFAEFAIGLNRVSGTGLVALDWLRARTGESFENSLKKFAGQYLASFTTPLRALSDIYASKDEREAVLRDTRDMPVAGPTLSNIPEISQSFPEKPSPLKSGTQFKGEPVEVGGKQIPYGIFRQATGLSLRTKTLVEREIDNLNMDWRSVSPMTGIPIADREMSRYMGPVVEKIAPKIIQSEGYKNLSEPAKSIAMKQMFTEARDFASKKLSVEHPAIFAATKIKDLKQEELDLIKERKDTLPPDVKSLLNLIELNRTYELR